jgi:hypothetical protein
MLEDVDVADDEWPTGDDVERRTGVRQEFHAAAGATVGAFGRLVGIGGGADGNGLALPFRGAKLEAEDLAMLTLTRMEAP